MYVRVIVRVKPQFNKSRNYELFAQMSEIKETAVRGNPRLIARVRRGRL